VSLTDKIAEIEEEIANTKYNKATQHHVGKLKAKLAQLREEVVTSSSGPKGSGYGVRKAGDATVALVGLPSVGKSTLLNSLTDAESETGSYAFTTLDVVPGVLKYRDANIQILDLPGLIEGAARGAGRGKEVLSVIRSADLIVHVIDATEPAPHVILKELTDSGVRLNSRPPNGSISKTGIGGIEVISTIDQELEDEAIKSIVREYGIVNAQVVFRERVTIDDIVDILSGTRVYTPSFNVISKVDMVKPADIKKIKKLCGSVKTVEVAAPSGLGVEKLKEQIYNSLEFISIFMKPQGEKADLEEPMVVRKGTTITEICQRLHRDFVRKFRFARIKGPSAKFDWQRVGLDHQLKDGDLLTIVVKR